MKLTYYPDVDQLYVTLHEAPSVESEEVAPGVVLDFDGDNRVVGIDIEHASEKMNLTAVSIHGLPLQD